MLRIILFLSLIVFFFGWLAGMTIYKIAQIVFFLVTIVIMLMMGSIMFSLMNTDYRTPKRIRA